MTHHDFFRDWNYKQWLDENLAIEPENEILSRKKAEYDGYLADGYEALQIGLLTDYDIQYKVDGVQRAHQQKFPAYDDVYAVIDIVYARKTGQLDSNFRGVYKTPNGKAFVIIRTAGSPAACGTVRISPPSW